MSTDCEPLNNTKLISLLTKFKILLYEPVKEGAICSLTCLHSTVQTQRLERTEFRHVSDRSFEHWD